MRRCPVTPLYTVLPKTSWTISVSTTAEDLPKLKEVFDEAMVNATNVNLKP